MAPNSGTRRANRERNPLLGAASHDLVSRERQTENGKDDADRDAPARERVQRGGRGGECAERECDPRQLGRSPDLGRPGPAIAGPAPRRRTSESAHGPRQGRKCEAEVRGAPRGWGEGVGRGGGVRGDDPRRGFSHAQPLGSPCRTCACTPWGGTRGEACCSHPVLLAVGPDGPSLLPQGHWPLPFRPGASVCQSPSSDVPGDPGPGVGAVGGSEPCTPTAVRAGGATLGVSPPCSGHLS